MDKSKEQLILNQLSFAKNKKIAFWGASCFLMEFLQKNNLNSFNIIGIIDNNKHLQNKMLLDYKIFNPNEMDIIPDIIIFTIKNQALKNYQIIQNIVKKDFPDTELLDNIFASTNVNTILSNKLFIIDEYGNRKQASYLPGVEIIWKGSNSIVEIGANPLPKFENCVFEVEDNCKISIGSSEYCIKKLSLYLKMNNSQLYIGNNFSSNKVTIFMSCEPNKLIKIGNNCMFSYGIIIRSSDGHTLFDINDKKILNEPNDIIIGDHVWVGQKVTILKNSKISNNTIIGANSLINKSFNEENVVITGIPAKVCKTNVNWDRLPPHKFRI